MPSTTQFARGLYSSPPQPQNVVEVNPTLLVSWWCTIFALFIILLRLAGRWIRTEKLFKEDKIMALSIIPLLARMALVHLVIRWGTNNVITTGLSKDDIWKREVGSRLVLLARIFYAAFLWIAKLTISEFLKRTYNQMWKTTYQRVLQGIRWFLVLTFVGICVATLAECTPFNSYWQVVPDPGPQCRQGYAQLLTMGVSDIITDLLLVAFPIPIVLASNMRLKRKISLCLLFGLSLILVAITIFRVQATVDHHSDQPFRSLLASLEILAAAAVSNALVLGSFVRDRGVKKAKFKFGSDGGESNLDRPSMLKTRQRGGLSWGSDVDLVGDIGMRLGPEFSRDKSTFARPAPAVLPSNLPSGPMSPGQSSWHFPGRESIDSDYMDLKYKGTGYDASASPTLSSEPSILTPRRMSFFDVGGLLAPNAPRQTTDQYAIPEGESISMQPLLHRPSRPRSPQGSRQFLDDVTGMHNVSRYERSPSPLTYGSKYGSK